MCFKFQAVGETEHSIAQTIPPLPSNIWTQYEYHVDTQQDISGDIASNVKHFVNEKSPQ